MNQIICTCRKTNGVVSFESTIQEYPLKWNKSVVTYCLLQGTNDIPDTHQIVEAIGLMFSTWGIEIPIKFRRVLSTQNPDITFKFVNGQTDPVIKGDDTVIAYSGFPDASGSVIHIILNDDLLFNFTHTNFAIDPNNTFLHETGHCLGLVHCPQDNINVMSPVYNGVVMLGPLDKSRIQAKYGTRSWIGVGYQRFITFLTYKKTHL